jgi:hypothetical protein
VTWFYTSLGYGQDQPQEYLLAWLTTIPVASDDANMATASLMGRSGTAKNFAIMLDSGIGGINDETWKAMSRPFRLGLILSTLVTLAVSASATIGQESPAPAAGASAVVDSSISKKEKNVVPENPHRFWDKENDWLFAGVGASRTLDYFSTLNMRSRGRQEIFLTNDVVDNHAAFAVIEASATGVSIGASYLFHRYGHHKLERWTSIAHIGLTTTGAVRNYCLKTAHAAPTPVTP